MISNKRPRETSADPYVAKITEWVERSSGKVRADVCHRKLLEMGYTASERTTRRVVVHIKATYHHQQSYAEKLCLVSMGLRWSR